MTKNYRPVTLLSVVNKVFEKPVNSMLFHHLEIYGLFSDLQYGFRYYQLTADFLTVVFDRIASALNRSGLELHEPKHLIYLRFSTKFGMLFFFPNLSLIEFLVRHLSLFCIF